MQNLVIESITADHVDQIDESLLNGTLLATSSFYDTSDLV